MKLGYDTKSKDPTYFIQQGYRIGNKTSTRNIKRIGKHSELLKITDDPLAYAKEQVAKYNEEVKNSKVSVDFSIDFGEKIKFSDQVVSSSTLRNVGYYYLQHIYHDLKIYDFFKTAKEGTRISFDPDLVNRFLTMDRIMDPGSKLHTVAHLSQYYEQPAFDHQHALRTMDLLEANYQAYISHLYEHSNSIVKRNTAVCYYDCSNFYFETEVQDEDYVDEVTGEIIQGLRRYGVSKEHRPNPIVEMGLFMDSDGIPISMCLHPGNQSEQTTAIPLEQTLLKMFKNKEFIYCADAGLGSYHIRNFNSMGGRSFVVTQSVKKLSSVLQTAVFNDCDYKLLSSGKPFSLEAMKSFDKTSPKNLSLYNDRIYKVIPANNLIDLGLTEEIHLKNGKVKTVCLKGTLKQNLIITFSRKMMEYQRYIRHRQIERAKKLLETIDPDTYRKGPNDVTRFIIRKSSGKTPDCFALDEKKIAEEEKYDGFYAVATNLEDDAATILGISSQRYKIEDCFRLMKTNLSSRPVYHQLNRRIKAHFMICFTALLIFRLLEKKLKDEGYTFSPLNIIETLQNMQVDQEDVFCKATYTNSQVLTALQTIYPESTLTNKYHLPKDLAKEFRKISK